MKRSISMLFAVFLLLSFVFVGSPKVEAAGKQNPTREIAIVFDNSRSMYQIDAKDGNPAVPLEAWCRATYAMEVFASMLNKGDTLTIYPMWPITVDGVEYTDDNPLKITDASQASKIRKIHTPTAWATPIRTIDCAAEGLKKSTADKKYLIVLTDGDVFNDLQGKEQDKTNTVKLLDERVKANASKSMMFMYLGIGEAASMPSVAESEYFVKRKAADTNDVLSMLTELCNLVFGRDTLPGSRMTGTTSGSKINFDVSMSKMIVFVQGTNVSNVKLSGPSGTQSATATTKYSENNKGEFGGSNQRGDYAGTIDTNLQGMMVTYTDCEAGEYTLEYSGTASSVEVYYEPNVDLVFEFTDSDFNEVDPNALYEGEYTVSFGLKDGKTGKFIKSDLLGTPHYEGTYTKNGEVVPFTSDGFDGKVSIDLKHGDEFKADLTVTYLSGYTISKDSTDFGWPEGGIKVAPRPAQELKMEISGGQGTYPLTKLEEGAPYTVKIFYKGQQLTGDALKNVTLEWDENASFAKIEKIFKDDHYELKLHHKNPSAPLDTKRGECKIVVRAFYQEPGFEQAKTGKELVYTIDEALSQIKVELTAPKDYIVIKDIESAPALIAKLTINDKPLTPEQFAQVKLQVDCGGLDYELTPNEKESSYLIKILPGDKAKEGNYQIKATAVHTDELGRETNSENIIAITLSKLALWLKWLIGISILILLIIIILLIMHIKVLPTKTHSDKATSRVTYDGEDITKNATVESEISGGQLIVTCRYNGRNGITMDVKPGKDSYFRKPHERRSAEAEYNSVKKNGTAFIREANIANNKYVFNEETRKFERAQKNNKNPIILRNGAQVKFSGYMLSAGSKKEFSVSTKLNFKKKK